MAVNTYRNTDSTQLSAHFNVQEFKCQCGKSHDILIDSGLIDKLEQLYTALNCSKIIVTSGYRCPEHDKAVGGTSSGQHTKGTAADVCCYGQDGQPISSKTVCCKAQDLGFGGIANITSSYQYTHLDVRTGYRWLGDETKGNGTVTEDFYKYFGLTSAKNILYGIDVSYCQQKIDWEKVKASGKVSFALIRAGFGKVLKNQVDDYFEENYAGCQKNGIPCGAFWYSYATSAAEAQQEANVCLQVLHGKQFAYPIYFDLEEKKQFALGKQVCSEMVEAFCSTLEQAGYYAGLYCSTFYLENYVTESVRNRYTVWCADYSSECGYSGNYGIWQKGCGTISGINGDVDLDECYIDYPTIIKNAGLNGFAKNATTTPENTQNGTLDTKKDTSDDDTLQQILNHVKSIDEKL